MKCFILLIMGLSALYVHDSTFESAVLVLTGASVIEDLTEDELDIYRHFREYPLDLNSASESRLRSSGLFSEIQLSSLVRMRRETGNILSYSELSLLSGFDAQVAEALKLFTVLRSGQAPGHLQRQRVSGSATVKASLRSDVSDESSDYSAAFGFKTDLVFGETAELRWVSRTTYSDPAFSVGTVSAAYYGHRFPGKVVLGDFAARFGQGLAQWSGFSMSSIGSPASLVRNAAGISATSSVSSSLCGIAGDCSFGRLQISAGASFKGSFDPVANVVYRLDNASFSLTGSRNSVGFDWRVGLPGVSLFGEVCWKGGPAAVAGIYCVPRYGSKLALRLGAFSPAYSRDYSGAALSYSNPFFTAGLDGGWSFACSMPQFKALLEFRYPYILSATKFSVVPSVRIHCRYRPYDRIAFRPEVRADLGLGYGPFGMDLRYDMLWYKGTAWLLYCEPCFKAEKLSVHARYTLFHIDSWDDRIYVYERDIPWAFSVPACYGRGESFLMYVGYSMRRWALYLRASFIHYPWNVSPKSSRAEVKLQLLMKW